MQSVTRKLHSITSSRPSISRPSPRRAKLREGCRSLEEEAAEEEEKKKKQEERKRNSASPSPAASASDAKQQQQQQQLEKKKTQQEKEKQKKKQEKKQKQRQEEEEQDQEEEAEEWEMDANPEDHPSRQLAAILFQALSADSDSDEEGYLDSFEADRWEVSNMHDVFVCSHPEHHHDCEEE